MRIGLLLYIEYGNCYTETDMLPIRSSFVHSLQ